MDCLKQISDKAVTESKVSLLLGTYTGDNSKQNSTLRKDQKNYQFSMKPNRIQGDAIISDKMTVNVNGSLPAPVWDFVNNYGLDLLKSDMSTATHTHDGHASLRTMTNVLIANQWTAIIQRCLRLTTQNDGRSITIVCVGDKF